MVDEQITRRYVHPRPDSGLSIMALDVYHKGAKREVTSINQESVDGLPTFMNAVEDINQVLEEFPGAKANTVIPRSDVLGADQLGHEYWFLCFLRYPERTYISTKSVSDEYATFSSFTVSELLNHIRIVLDGF
jgi:hypothetical protein